MIWLLMPMLAHANTTFTLDSGAELHGELLEYHLEGSCQIAVVDGELAGTIMVVPCERIARFERTAPPPAPAPALAPPAPIEEEVVDLAPAPPLIPETVPVEEAPFATAPETPEPPPMAAAAPPAPPAPEPPPVVEEEAAAAEASMWSDVEAASPAPEAAAEPSPSIISGGGLALPPLPNLRMMRRAPAPPASEEAE